MKTAIIVFALCWAVCFAGLDLLVKKSKPEPTLTADVCQGKPTTYQFHIIDSTVYKPSGANCSYQFTIASGSCLVATGFKTIKGTYLCYNTDGFWCTPASNTLEGFMIEWCDNVKKTVTFTSVTNYAFKQELALHGDGVILNVFPDLKCDGVPFNTPRFCDFAYGLPTAFALLALIALILL